MPGDAWNLSKIGCDVDVILDTAECCNSHQVKQTPYMTSTNVCLPRHMSSGSLDIKLAAKLMAGNKAKTITQE